MKFPLFVVLFAVGFHCLAAEVPRALPPGEMPKDARLGPLTVVWDRSNIHSRSKLVKQWLARHPGVMCEDFPGYVPDLNPDEGVWAWTKYGRLANLAAADTDELWDQVVEQLVEVKHRPDLLRGFIRHTGLPGLALAA